MGARIRCRYCKKEIFVSGDIELCPYCGNPINEESVDGGELSLVSEKTLKARKIGLILGLSIGGCCLTVGAILAISALNRSPAPPTPPSVKVPVVYEPFLYEENGTGGYIVKGNWDKTLETIKIPASYQGKPVVAIGENAFSGYSSASLEIPDSVTSIGESAFVNCSGLTEVVIPDGVTSIGESAFVNCSGLTEVVIPDSVTSIGDHLFQECIGLTSIVLPQGITSIGDYSFYGCSSLKGIVIPSGVTDMGDGTFYGCSSLTELVIPDGVTSIDTFIFAGCSNLTSVTIPDSVMSIGDGAFKECGSLTEIFIPEGVTEFGSSVFYECSSLTRVTIPDSATLLWQTIFSHCYNLEYNEKDGLNYLGNESNPYLYLAKPTSTDIAAATIADTCKVIGAWAFYGCNSLTSVTIPDGVTCIGEDAFKECIGLTSLIIPSGVMHIGDYAFENCDNLAEVYYEGTASDWESLSVENMDTVVYYYSVLPPMGSGKYWCYEDGVVTKWGLTFDISSGTHAVLTRFKGMSVARMSFIGTYQGLPVTTIGKNAFENCSGLERIVLPNSVTNIEENAFLNCNSLTEVYYEGTASEWASVSVDSTNEAITNATVYYYSETDPTGSGNYWRYVDGTATRWMLWYDTSSGTHAVLIGCMTSATQILIPATYQGLPVTGIAEDAFSGCGELTDVVIGENVTSIGSRAFGGCTILKSVTLGENMTSIGAEAFSNCTSLTSIVIPNGVAVIGMGMFEGCTNLTSIVIPSSVTNIEENAFLNCNRLTEVYYEGTASEWASLSVDSTNEALTNATVYYYSETLPTERGNYWCYVGGTAMKW